MPKKMITMSLAFLAMAAAFSSCTKTQATAGSRDSASTQSNQTAGGSQDAAASGSGKPATTPVASSQGRSGSEGAQSPGAQGTQQGGAVPSGRRQTLIPVQATTIQSGSLVAQRTTAAVIVPVTQSQVAAMTAGIVSRVNRQVGDWVKSGETIVQLDDTQLSIAQSNTQAALETAKINLAAVKEGTSQNNARFELQVKSAQASLDSAQRYYDSQKALFELGGISAYTLDQAGNQLTASQVALETAKTNLEQNRRGFATTPGQNVEALKVVVTTAQNNLRQAQVNLRNAAIKAPFSGQIAAIAISSGMYVGQNTAAFTLVSAEKQISFGVSPADAPALPTGKMIAFEYGGTEYPVRIKQAPSVPVNGTVPMIADPGIPFDLPFGSVGNVKYGIVLASGALVPVMAIGTAENRNYIFVIEDGRAVQKPISIIAESGATAVVNGIEAGTVAILSPPPGLIQGSTVQPIMAQQRSSTPGATSGTTRQP
jgi:multidrug efflux pump subunit AcrA (membrane-fusion protein)